MTSITANEQLHDDIARIAKLAGKLAYEFGNPDYRKGKQEWIDSLPDTARALEHICAALDARNLMTFIHIILATPACAGKREIVNILSEWDVTRDILKRDITQV